MEMIFLAILIIGIISSVFGVLMIFAPTFILKVERSANQLYMTDAALMNNRIPLGIFMLIASGFLVFSYYSGPYKEIVFLYLSIIAGIFGLLLLIKPNMILIAERKANKLYMTDAFFLKHRILLGIILIVASVFMLRTYFLFGLT
jgi:hypothetical protein